VAGCTTFVDGRVLSIVDDPYRVGDLPAANGPSGPRQNAPKPTGTVNNSDDGDIDKLALLGLNDIETFWKQAYHEPLKGTFTPVETFYSYNSKDPQSPPVCGLQTYRLYNAFYTSRCGGLFAWDRGGLMPDGRHYFGDMSIPGVLSHEYGHAIQHMAKLVNDATPTIVLEQQADCFAGFYLSWVAQGNSPRFVLSTGDGLDHELAGLITLRDPVMESDDYKKKRPQEHGSALDRVSAMQIGFITGIPACAAIDMTEIVRRRADLPTSLREDQSGNDETGEVPLNRDELSTLMEVLGKIFSPKQPPTLSYNPADCPNAKASPPASYCPDTNTITVDMPGLQKMAQVAGLKQHVLPQGDDTAFSVVMSRYVLAVQRERDLPLDTPWTALRTACLTGVAHRKMAEPIDVPSGITLRLTAGDLDKAISGLLTNHLVASDVNGVTVPAGFTRIAAFRDGLGGDTDGCYRRFP
jgi:predicted metalloprotease